MHKSRFCRRPRKSFISGALLTRASFQEKTVFHRDSIASNYWQDNAVINFVKIQSFFLAQIMFHFLWRNGLIDFR